MNEILKELEKLEAEILEAAQMLGLDAMNAAKARAEYDLGYAKAILRESSAIGEDGKKRTVSTIEAVALLAVEQEMLDARLSEAMLEASKKRFEAIRTVISSVQSRASLIGIEANLVKFKA